MKGLLNDVESNIIYLREIEKLTQQEVAEKLNYSVRQVQRIYKSAQNKILIEYVNENSSNLKKS